MPLPGELRLLLRQHDGPASEPAVKVGADLEVGQRYGRAGEPDALNLHSPAAGQVTAIGETVTAEGLDSPVITLRVDAEATASAYAVGADTESGDPADMPTPCTVATLAEAAEQAGIATEQENAAGFGPVLRQASEHGIETLIINGIPREPTVTATRSLMLHHTRQILSASLWLRAALGARRGWWAVDRTDRRGRLRCRAATRRTPMRLAELTNKYPQASPALLASVITGQEKPYGRSLVSMHVLVVEVETLLALYRAVRYQRPVTHRVITVAGPAVRRPGDYTVAIGTPFAHILANLTLRRPAARVVQGGPMTGTALHALDHPVTQATDAITVIDHAHDHLPRPGPCIRCGWCQDDCPVGLDPFALLDAFERDDLARAGELHVHACLNCGLCSYICPTELPMGESIQQLKRRTPLANP